MADANIASKLAALEKSDAFTNAVQPKSTAANRWRPNAGDSFVGVYLRTENNKVTRRKSHHFAIRVGEAIAERVIMGTRSLNGLIDDLGSNTPVKVVYVGDDTWQVFTAGKK